MENKKKLTEALTWDDFSLPESNKIEREYLPGSGEGDNMMSQAVTASTKLIYRWFNDGDVFDTTSGYLIGWFNDLSSYANWLYKYIPEVKNILNSIYACHTEDDYTELLYNLFLTAYTQKMVDKYSSKAKVGSIYDCDGPFKFVEPEEDDDEEDFEDEDSDLDESLTEDTHAKYAKPEGDRIKAFNNALKYAKKENKPFIYGYTNSTGKFFAIDQPIKCNDITAQTKEFKNKYKNSNVVYVAYPDKEFVKEELKEDYELAELNDLFAQLDYYATHNKPLNIDLADAVLKEDVEPIKEDCLPDWEKKKQRTLKYYNTIKEWAGDDAINNTSSRFNVGVDQLTEWIEGENKND